MIQVRRNQGVKHSTRAQVNQPTVLASPTALLLYHTCDLGKTLSHRFVLVQITSACMAVPYGIPGIYYLFIITQEEVRTKKKRRVHYEYLATLQIGMQTHLYHKIRISLQIQRLRRPVEASKKPVYQFARACARELYSGFSAATTHGKSAQKNKREPTLE